MDDLGVRNLPLAAGLLIIGAALGVGGTLLVQRLWPADAAGSSAGGTPGGHGLPVEVETVEPAALPVVYETLGALRSPQRAVLRPVERGRVTGIHFADGAAVAEKQLLVEFESAHQRALLAEAEAERDEAERQLEQARALRADQAITQDALERREAALAAAEARVAEAEAELADRLIHAPFAGTVTRKAISLGDTVGPEDRIVELIRTDELRVSTAIPERYLSALRDDITLSARSPALPGRDFDAVISYIAPEIDSANRSIAVEATLDNSDGLLRHGQSVDVSAVVSTLPDSLSVPEEAVLHQGNRISVFVVVDGQAQPRELTLGPRGKGRVVVTAGLEHGDRVVVEGHEMLRPGAPVEIVDDADGGP